MTTTSKCLRIFALTLAVVAFLIGGFIGGTAAYAADIPTAAVIEAETLTVDDVWLTGDTLHIAVTDKTSGSNQTLELNLSDYAKSGDEYVTIRATDSAGRVSNAIQFKNPYYTPVEENPDATDNGGNSGNPNAPADATAEYSDPSNTSESAITENGKPFTPSGTGSVVDNATGGDGKEFFTVETADGNVFYLIVDRQRSAENVYLLNAVTEDDLASLAKQGNGKNGGATNSAVSVPETPQTTAAPEVTATPEPAPAKSGGNTGMIGIVIVVLIVVGGAGYYFKIVRPKKAGYDYEAEDETDDSAETSEDFAAPRDEESFGYATSDEEREVEESEVDGE